MSQILVVDDSSNITSILEERFSELGYRVLTAQNAYEALEILAENSVDLVITDIVMPGPSGLYLIADIQSNYPRTKVIAISNGGRQQEDLMYGDRSQEDMKMYFQKAKEKGAVHCVEKPFKTVELVATVKEVLGESQS